jgi:dCMP deaminase
MKRTLQEWDIFQLKLAKHYSTMSRDPSTKVGAVVTDMDSKYVYGLGYNGFPPDIPDTEDHLNNRAFKYQHTIHAELNSLASLSRRSQGSLVPSTDSVNWEPLTLFVYPFVPCLHCAQTIVDDYPFVTRVVSLDYSPERWSKEFQESRKLFEQCDIEVTLYPYKQVGVE